MQKTIDGITYRLDKPVDDCNECAGEDVALCTKLGYDCLDTRNVWQVVDTRALGQIPEEKQDEHKNLA